MENMWEQIHAVHKQQEQEMKEKRKLEQLLQVLMNRLLNRTLNHEHFCFPLLISVDHFHVIF